MQKIFFTGGVGRDAELKQTKAGEDVLTFPVGVSQGYGDNKTTNWFRCNMWGKRARNLQQYLLKGAKVAVAGSLTIGEYEGKAQFNVTVDEVEFMSRSENAERKPTAHDKAKANGYQPDNYLDDDMAPF
jgi:single-strand DNA-binding protein